MTRYTIGLLAVTLAWGTALAAQGAKPAAPQPAKPAAAQTKAPERFGIGRPATEAEVAARDIDIMPDGHGLPPGRGTPAEGAAIYAEKCSKCHGATGKEGPNDVLVGRTPNDSFDFSTNPKLPKSLGSYWPYSTTIFDYVRRAMPPQAPGSLTDNEVYAVVAHLLHLNQLIAADAVMDATSLAKVVMPARDRFVPDPKVMPKPKK